jgi:hypothetical protein
MNANGGSLTVLVLGVVTMSDNGPRRTLPDNDRSMFRGISWGAAMGRDGPLITVRGTEDRDDDLDGCGSRRGGGTKGASGTVDDCSERSEAVRSVPWARGLCAFVSRGDRFLVSGSRLVSLNVCPGGVSWSPRGCLLGCINPEGKMELGPITLPLCAARISVDEAPLDDLESPWDKGTERRDCKSCLRAGGYDRRVGASKESQTHVAISRGAHLLNPTQIKLAAGSRTPGDCCTVSRKSSSSCVDPSPETSLLKVLPLGDCPSLATTRRTE